MLQLQEAEGLLAGEEGCDQRGHRAHGGGQVRCKREDMGRGDLSIVDSARTLIHKMLELIVPDEVLVFVAEESPPLTHLQDDQVNQVDDDDHEGHEQKSLSLEHGQAVGAAQGECDNRAEHVLSA